MKASRIDKLMFELHQKKNLPEKKANRINKLMYGLHQRKDPKKTNSVQASKNHLLSGFRLINTEFTRPILQHGLPCQKYTIKKVTCCVKNC